MRRKPGTKSKMSKRIITYFSKDIKGMNYYEPVGGCAYMFRQVIRNELPFQSYHVGDKFEWDFNYLSALRGDLLFDGIDIVYKIEDHRNRLSPEDEHEDKIRQIFEAMKIPCRAGDPFAFLFLCMYARGQYVYPQRPDTASFDARYLGSGISTLTRAKVLDWRWILQHATVKQMDAFELLPTLGSIDFSYL